jgi:predicted metal-dependent peptidase
MYRTPNPRMTAGRTRLLLDFPWFGSLAMRLQIAEAPEIKTFNVDGTTLKYNPEFLETLSDSELTAVIAHEVMHCALLHPYRRGNRDLKLWNEACDYAINSELIASGLKLPDGCKIDPQYAGLSADVIYSQLSKNQQPQGENESQEPEPSTGSVGDAPAHEPGQQTESDWKIAAEQASGVGRMAGKLPGGAAELAKAARQEPQDWRALLLEFVENTVPSDYSWTSPNRRHVANGLYLPGVTRENLGHIAVAVDTSGSISPALLSAFCQELNAIAHEAHPDKVTVLYCDAQLRRTEEFGPDDDIVLTAEGRGGTCFQPVFDAVAAWPEPPVCLIYFTDMDASDKPTEPDYPVLWATDFSAVRTETVPFGQVARLRLEYPTRSRIFWPT